MIVVMVAPSAAQETATQEPTRTLITNVSIFDGTSEELITGRDLEEWLEGRRLGKHRVFGIGPEVTVPIATRSKLIALLNVRYFWEAGARTTLEGQNLVVTATFPVPSVRLQ